MENPNEALLKQINEGCQMAVSSIDGIMEKAQKPTFKQHLERTKQSYEQYQDNAADLLLNYNTQPQKISNMAEWMAKINGNVKTMLQEGDDTIADMMFQGVTMGIKSISRTLNARSDADESTKQFAHRYLDHQYAILHDMGEFL